MEPKTHKEQRETEGAGRAIALALARYEKFNQPWPKGEHGKYAKLTDDEIDALLAED